MPVYTTEITSDKIPSDNPIHQRLLQAYYVAKPYVKGKLLELGCGEGRGLEVLSDEVSQYVALDKHQEVIDQLQQKYPKVIFKQAHIPPLKDFDEDSFDTVIAFQVIEHIKDDHLFLKEIYRVLKKGGKAIISTPNKKMSLTRNPWHVREYTADELTSLAGSIFPVVKSKGIAGNQKVMSYYEMNRQSVRKITRFDVFNLQYKLPAGILRIPYDILNRVNRNRLKTTDDALVKSIGHHDYPLSDQPEQSLDLFYIMEK
ncbi:MAG: class I SAM-dependent methyltransferase [Candidatus Cyclobacteriaceae bacterium M3_2C_046]